MGLVDQLSIGSATCRVSRVRLERHDGVEWTVDGDKEVLSDELVELQVVHVPSLPDLRRVHDDEQTVRVAVHPRNVAALLRGVDRQRVTVQLVPEQPFRVFGPELGYEPGEAVGPFQKLWEVAGRALDASMSIQRSVIRSGCRAPPALDSGGSADERERCSASVIGPPVRQVSPTQTEAEEDADEGDER